MIKTLLLHKRQIFFFRPSCQWPTEGHSTPLDKPCAGSHRRHRIAKPK